MFKKLFGKKETVIDVELLSPLSGKSIDLDEVPDPVFSQKMLGDGIAIDPSEGVVVAPVEGEVIQVFPTKHAIGLRADNGAEILIHIGLETVSMEGEGFTSHIKAGDRVKQGDKLVTFNMELVREKAKSTITPIIITNSDHAASLEKLPLGNVERGQTPIIKISMI